MTMLEKAAKALLDRAGHTEYGLVVPEALATDLARAVLMAVRDLPDQIVEDHLSDLEHGFGAFYYEAWQPTIDAILTESDNSA